MFRLIIVLISLTVAGNALSTFYSQGLREDGDSNISTGRYETYSRDNIPMLLYVSVKFRGDENTTVTQITYDVEEVDFYSYFVFFFCLISFFFLVCFQGYDEILDFGIGDVRITNFNTSQLMVNSRIYGFIKGYVPEERDTDVDLETSN